MYNEASNFAAPASTEEHKSKLKMYQMKFSYLNEPKKRTRTTPEQLAILIQAFEKNSLPSPKQRKLISEKTGMSTRAIQVWFQNKRAKLRTKQKGSRSSKNGEDNGQKLDSEFDEPETELDSELGYHNGFPSSPVSSPISSPISDLSAEAFSDFSTEASSDNYSSSSYFLMDSNNGFQNFQSFQNLPTYQNYPTPTYQNIPNHLPVYQNYQQIQNFQQHYPTSYPTKNDLEEPFNYTGEEEKLYNNFNSIENKNFAYTNGVYVLNYQAKKD